MGCIWQRVREPCLDFVNKTICPRGKFVNTYIKGQNSGQIVKINSVFLSAFAVLPLGGEQYIYNFANKRLNKVIV